ncbi:flagellar protein FlaG [Gottfriedia luciferensis]|uniref:flagellar protein FlaG n=1 Tax=Gottfriedia luciferensis TaxID=178774 RepID=UPI000B44A0FF|nr:flagellar protein FlaG [Gottfriedia luciferensis]
MIRSVSKSTLAKSVPNIPVQQQSQEVYESLGKEKVPEDVIVPKKDLEKIIDGMNKLLEPKQTTLEFKLHEETNRYYAVIVDANTKEVVKEIPAKKLLDFYAAMEEFLGLMFDKKI